ncbi:hypothetical protein TVAG_029610 [Trichomonas vaginalis G3]|uniref:Ubiquitin-like domain-containing protein n=1 Tax=Trichomonas vaginalis (strain ATCC PRA-98 / G3) TaxID=412133 RepID=A2FKJ5_TRIV3|nr:uncharacterized protein TVAGG3_1077470 [Trichomonas vaginalis G3]EAX94568.1 hypothetical protein TVAG_029610 [Trichomonas vaginalis G3]KAI5482788.1 hypothetical protein TVAGG3_1077470 [Trichomonas vaginalis G3]|eukprot:XP_001307498.1 hypothetical protein [Trichomonas vaginalis G3]
MDPSTSVNLQEFNKKHISKNDVSQVIQNSPDSMFFVGIPISSQENLSELQKKNPEGRLIMPRQTKLVRINNAKSKKNQYFRVCTGMSLSELQKELIKANFISSDESICFNEKGTVLPDDYVFSDTIPASLAVKFKMDRTSSSQINNQAHDSEPNTLEKNNSSQSFPNNKNEGDNSKNELEKIRQSNEKTPTPVSNNKSQVSDDDHLNSEDLSHKGPNNGSLITIEPNPEDLIEVIDHKPNNTINFDEDIIIGGVSNNNPIDLDIDDNKIAYSASQENIDENEQQNQEIMNLLGQDSKHGNRDGDLSSVLLTPRANKNKIKNDDDIEQKSKPNNTTQSDTHDSDDYGSENEKVDFLFYFYSENSLVLYDICLPKHATINEAKEILKKSEEFQDGKFYIVCNGKKLDPDSKIGSNDMGYYIQRYVEVNVRLDLPISNNGLVQLNAKIEAKPTDILHNINLYTGDLTGIYLKKPSFFVNKSQSSKTLVSKIQNELESQPLILTLLNESYWDKSIIVLKITGEINCRIKVKPKDMISDVKSEIKRKVSAQKDFELRNSNDEKLELTNLVEDIIKATNNTAVVAHYI